MPIKFTASNADPLGANVEVLVLGVAEGAPPRSGVLGALSKAIGPSFARALAREEFTGKRGASFEIATAGKMKAAHVMIYGLGAAGAATDVDVRVMAAKGARLANATRATSIGLAIPAGSGVERAAAEGVVLGAYRFTKYLTGDRKPKSEIERAVVFFGGKIAQAQKDEIAIGERIGLAITIARDLINEPPNELYPDALAQAAVAMCKANGLEVKVFDKPALEKKGMKLILAVGQGSRKDPRMVHMTYKPAEPKGKKRLVFVGKGLTFDTGGICIKPAPGMEEMKGDMGGAANVIALMAAVAATKPDCEVHGLIGCAENMPDGNAYRPGDIFGSYDGKTVEIINTDAEGRLVLADVLAYGKELKPDVMLDNATLTGACVVALGTTVSGFYSNRDELAERFKGCVKAAGEAMWHMPLVEDLREGLKSDWADLKHVADRWGGSITAALFLREFVGDSPWIHVDIAGPSMANKAYNVFAKGGTGHGVLSYLALIDSFATAQAK